MRYIVPAMPSALFERFPALKGQLAYRSLGRFPTAIERVTGLVSERVELYVKREDQAAALYGGNKVRKLELLLADPHLGAPGLVASAEPDAVPGVAHQSELERRVGRAASRPRLIVYGTYASNYTLAAGLFGRELGYEVAAVLYPQPVTPLVHDRLREQLGAGIRLWPSPSYLQVPFLRLQARRAGSGSGPGTELAPGGSSPLGTLGWVAGGLEILGQVQAGVAPRFDAVYAALGSGGMVAGLWLGLGESAAELVAVRVVPWPVASYTTVGWLAGRTQALLRRLHVAAGAAPPAPRRRPRLRLDGRWIGGGYAHPTPAGQAALQRSAACGLQLEPTYTGKTMAALLADADAGLLDGKRVLFINSYSSVDLSALRERGDPQDLPPWLVRRLSAAGLIAA